MVVANTLAYYKMATITALKRFKAQPPVDYKSRMTRVEHMNVAYLEIIGSKFQVKHSSL
jgi:hypothetical protein